MTKIAAGGLSLLLLSGPAIAKEENHDAPGLATRVDATLQTLDKKVEILKERSEKAGRTARVELDRSFSTSKGFWATLQRGFWQISHFMDHWYSQILAFFHSQSRKETV